MKEMHVGLSALLNRCSAFAHLRLRSVPERRHHSDRNRALRVCTHPHGNAHRSRQAAPRDFSRRAALAGTTLLLCGVLAFTAGCSSSGSGASTPSADSGPSSAIADNSNVQTFTPASGSADVTLKLASGSENKEAAEAIQHAVDTSHVAVELHYMGSLDIMHLLQNGGEDYDAVWPASSMWISMGDTSHIVKDAQSTSTTPVVFGIAQSKAQELGWADTSGVTSSPTTAEILQAVKDGKLTFAMTSATQSNSGASAYLAFLTALKGTDGPLSAADLGTSQLTDQVAQLLAGVDRSSGSSDWLKEMVVADPDAHSAMVNYESLVSQANRELEDKGHEPLMVIYPADGIAISDSPLGYVDRGQDNSVEQAFADFQQALGDKDAALALERVGRRTGLGGKVVNADDSQVQQAFSPAWGIVDDASVLRSIPLPAADVITQALTMYQTSLKKPSYTVWVVDYSGSMYGEGKDGVVNGLEQALDPSLAAESMIQPTEDDVNVLIPFSTDADQPVEATGSDTGGLLNAARAREATGGTDIYAGLEEALRYVREAQADGGYTVAIALMTDGQSDTWNRDAFFDDYRNAGLDVPIFSIMFGDADPSQLDELSELSNGRTFDGRTGDLAAVFRQVKGYN